MHLLISILPGLAKILLSIILLLLLWSPVIYLVLFVIYSAMGKREVFYRYLAKMGFKPNSKLMRGYDTPSSKPPTLSIQGKAKSNNHGFPKDYHTNPRYCNSPTNSSYNTLGPGTWNKKI